ncbi:MAG: molecular chaperone DnaK [Deltaproteobacteria bacterium]|nr:molecular chaperone DnaK [Deltaproteobacteria bacterium]
MSKVVGIDLGTTNSCVAIVENGQPVVIPNAEGSRTTPSVVAFAASGERLVGQVAKRQSATNPENTVFAVKRLMGRRFDSEEAQRQARLAPYRIVGALNGDAWVQVRDRELSPPEISAMVLGAMRGIAESYLGETVTEAVVTVPAYFDDAQRQATKDAGKIAGLDVKRIINEPTAAAIAYGLDKKESQRIAVYDLGGGTFDISVLEIAKGVFNVRATNGDTHLGGEDFDQVLIDFLANSFQADNPGIDLRNDRLALQRLKEQAERAKHELSSSLETEINLPFIASDAAGPKHLVLRLTRQKLEELTEPLVERTLEPCRKALADAGLKTKDIDEVVLVGGMTRMPLVVKRVTQFFGKEPHKGVNPDEVVAVGAALQAGALKGEVDDVLLLDVTPLSLGVEVGGGIFHTLIPRNTTIPTRKTEIFTTSVDNQDFVPVHVLQGERHMAADNKSLARFELTGIPPAPRGLPQIEVAFDIDANGMVSVVAKDLGTGREQSVRVIASSGLTPAQIEAIVAEAEQFEQTDQKRRELAELRNSAEALLYSTERAIGEMAEIVSPEMLGDAKTAAAALRTMLDQGGDAIAIKEALQALELASYRMAESLYAAPSETPSS